METDSVRNAFLCQRTFSERSRVNEHSVDTSQNMNGLFVICSSSLVIDSQIGNE
jgi:hypothetical protein